VLGDPADMEAYLSEPRDLHRGRALYIVRPGNAAQVASVLALCSEFSVGVVPQGGNTGLVGGQTPDSSGQQIIVSLQRLDRVRDVDPASNVLTLEAGVTLARAQEIALSIDRYFPLSLASEGSCTIGGNLATNAGGVHVLAYGAARDLVLGLEVALADGRVLSTLGKLRKDNTGYNLTQLFVGSEGTLGVITAATLKLFPRPRGRAIAFVGLSDPADALALLNFMKDRAGPTLQAFELMPRIGLELVLRHIPGARDPLAAVYPWYALVEIAGYADGEAERVAASSLAQAHETGLAQDATLSHSLDQAAALWRLRESMSEAQKREGGSIKHDISVPIERIPAFIEEAGRRITARFPQARPVSFGHMGDGNLHYNVTQPVGADKAAFLACRDEMNEIVHGLVHEFSGSISAEHGIGTLKRAHLHCSRSPEELALMRTLKAALDPLGILNPGKVLAPV